MADTKISNLTAATTPLDGTEVLPIVQGSTTKKVANNDLRPKQIQSNATSGVMQIAGPAAAATRVMTIPDANFTVARKDAAQSFTGVQTFGSATGQNGVFGVVVGSGGTNEGLVIVPGATGKGWIGFNNGNTASIPGQITYDFSTGVMNLFSSGDITVNTNASGTVMTKLFVSGGVSIGNTTDPGATNLSVSGNILSGTTSSSGSLSNVKTITGGIFQTFSGTTASLVNGATEDITGLISGATYLVTCKGSANTTTFVIHTVYINGAGGITLATLSNGNGFVLTSPSNNTLRVTGLVTTQTYPYTLTRIF